MADSVSIAVVRQLYEARGNPDIIREVLALDIKVGSRRRLSVQRCLRRARHVRHDFFGRLFQDFESFVATGSEFFESGDRVIALGNYTGRAKATGKEFTARFAHVWTLQEGHAIPVIAIFALGKSYAVEAERRLCPLVHRSTCSDILSASSTSTPKYLAVLSIFVCPSNS